MENEFEEKYRTLFRRYYAGLSFYAARLVGEDDAEDIVQDVFLEIWKRKDTVELGGQIQSFLYRSVYTRAINVLNHKAVVENYTAEEAELMKKKLEYYQPDQSEVIRRIENRELRQEIFQAINGLPEKCREVFKLSYLYDMKNKDIADTLSISLRTVEAHMYKALKILRERLSHLHGFLLLLVFFSNIFSR
ncbi:RNA polymerase sigma-70 factor [Bacteroides gallinaceum]|uniref:RNA polymerase sigma-70 factor n=1 Tax=Bacteroides gallinaceum TaxID=1462571 RepID=A0ABT7VCV1_9BACE|nr:RNA polymerase sigma-70 factor [Bacteroides gallinaceum]MDM8324113.1 RNA polymerase sigma-70 factor [Bacteroides gallinaceum]